MTKQNNAHELIGAELNQLVAKFAIDDGHYPIYMRFYTDGRPDAPHWGESGNSESFHPSTNWRHGGPIIEREGIALRTWNSTWYAMAIADAGSGQTMHWNEYTCLNGERYGPLSFQVHKRQLRFVGTTPLIAAMRCYVASRQKGTSCT
jgi:hypothetical protein